MIRQNSKTKYVWYDPEKDEFIGLLWREIDYASDHYGYDPYRQDRFLRLDPDLYWAERKDSPEQAEDFRSTFPKTDTSHWVLCEETVKTVVKEVGT